MSLSCGESTGLEEVGGDSLIDLASGHEKIANKLRTFPGPETIRKPEHETIRDLLTAEVERRSLHTVNEKKPSKEQWTAFYNKSFAPDGLLFNVFRPYQKESVHRLRPVRKICGQSIQKKAIDRLHNLPAGTLCGRSRISLSTTDLVHGLVESLWPHF